MTSDTNPAIKGSQPGVLGCSLAHLMSIKEAYIEGLEVALFAEDDASFDLWPFWTHSLEEYLALLPAGWHISQLSSYYPKVEGELKRPFVLNETGWGIAAFFMSKVQLCL